jgi:flagellar biosynthetic protein FliO
MTLLQAADAGGSLPGGYAAALLETLLALAAVCILAWVVLKWGARRGLGRAARGRVRVLERVPLDPKRSVYLVRVGDRMLLLGAGDGAAPTVLAELDPDEVFASDSQRTTPGSIGSEARPADGSDHDRSRAAAQGSAFAEVLGRLRRPKRSD